MLFADGLSKFFHNGNSVFINGPRRLVRNSANFIVLKVDFLIILYCLMHYLRKICKVTIYVEKLVTPLEMTFFESFIVGVTLVAFFVAVLIC